MFLDGGSFDFLPVGPKRMARAAELIQVVKGLLEPSGSLPTALSPLPTGGWGGRGTAREKSFLPSLRGGQLVVLALLPKGLASQVNGYCP